MTSPPTTDLAPLLIRWLTHDLASPVATALTASELLGDKADAEINGLVQDAARHLAGRLKLIRTALAPGEGAIGQQALAALLRAGLGETPIDWQVASDCSGTEAALIASAALLLADVRRGQALTIAGDGVRWATAWSWPEPLAAALAGAPPTEPRAALAAMVAAAAGRAGRSLAVTVDGLSWAGLGG